MNVDEVRIRLQRFGWPDYIVFIMMLASCALIGVYFAFQMRREAKERKSKGQKDAEDTYLVGGRNMHVFPITMSLIASFISGITLLGTPTEVYLYGTQYLYIMSSLILMGFIMYHFFLPVFHDLQLISTYQYLESRYDKSMRLFGSLLFIFGACLWLPIVIYVPALAFNQATGINIHLVTPIVSLVCIFYTCVGGLKAVVWTDVVQTLIMFAGMALIIIKGTMDVGGPSVVFAKAKESGRLETPNFTFDLTERYTVYSLVIGGIAHWLKSNAINQNMIQRYLSLPTLKSARTAVWSFIFGVLVFLCVCGYAGLLIYATYSDCDPLQTKGALVGGVSSIIFMAWMAIRAQADLASGVRVYTRKPYTTKGCNYTFPDFASMNVLAENTSDITKITREPFHIYNISYLYYTLLGAIITIVIALIISFALGANRIASIDERLLSPFMRRWVERRRACNSIISTKLTELNNNNNNNNNYNKSRIVKEKIESKT